MLTIKVPMIESFDESTSMFVITSEFTLELEHSLVSLSKWESEFEKPFLTDKEKTPEEALAYVKAMVLTPNVPPEVFYKLSKENVTSINDYIGSKQSATWFSDGENQPPSRQVITSELIYCWMFSMGISKECELWHLRRLFTLIRVFNAQNAPKKRQNRRQDAVDRRALNEQRRKQYGTSG